MPRGSRKKRPRRGVETPDAAVSAAAASASTSLPLLDTLLAHLALPSEDVTACYVSGSRLWGTSKPTSDYDLVVVIKDKCASCARIGANDKAQVHGPGVDACLITQRGFWKRVEDHAFVQLCCLWVPRSCQLRVPADGHKHSVTIQPCRLFTSVVTECIRDWKRALLCMRKARVDTGRKVLAHTMRMLTLATQIIRHGRVTDFTAGNDVGRSIRRDFRRDWKPGVLLAASAAEKCVIGLASDAGHKKALWSDDPAVADCARHLVCVLGEAGWNAQALQRELARGDAEADHTSVACSASATVIASRDGSAVGCGIGVGTGAGVGVGAGAGVG